MREGVAAADATISHSCRIILLVFTKIKWNFLNFKIVRHSTSSLVILNDFLLLIRPKVDYSSARELKI